VKSVPKDIVIVPPTPRHLSALLFGHFLAGFHFYYIVYSLTAWHLEPKGQLPAMTFREFRTHLSEKLWRKLWAERLWDCRNKYRMGMRMGKSQSTSHFVYLIWFIVDLLLLFSPFFLGLFCQLRPAKNITRHKSRSPATPTKFRISVGGGLRGLQISHTPREPAG